MREEEKEQRQSAVEKIVAVMELLCLSGETFSLREIESRTGIPRSTLHRLLLSLEKVGWVTRDASSERFRPGVHFFLLHRGDLFHGELIRIAGPEMERLVRETGKTAVMSVLEGTTGLCIHHVEPKGTAVKYVAHRGMGVPVHVGATGKVLLAFCREDLRERIFAAGLPEGVDGDALRRQLAEIRKRGYAYSREEWMEHAGDISVPLVDGRGEFVAQLGLAGLVTSFEGQEEALVAKLKDAAARMSGALQSVFSG